MFLTGDIVSERRHDARAIRPGLGIRPPSFRRGKSPPAISSRGPSDPHDPANGRRRRLLASRAGKQRETVPGRQRAFLARHSRGVHARGFGARPGAIPSHSDPTNELPCREQTVSEGGRRKVSTSYGYAIGAPTPGDI